jgi:hypothetical protein
MIRFAQSLTLATNDCTFWKRTGIRIRTKSSCQATDDRSRMSCPICLLPTRYWTIRIVRWGSEKGCHNNECVEGAFAQLFVVLWSTYNLHIFSVENFTYSRNNKGVTADISCTSHPVNSDIDANLLDNSLKSALVILLQTLIQEDAATIQHLVRDRLPTTGSQLPCSCSI